MVRINDDGVYWPLGRSAACESRRCLPRPLLEFPPIQGRPAAGKTCRLTTEFKALTQLHRMVATIQRVRDKAVGSGGHCADAVAIPHRRGSQRRGGGPLPWPFSGRANRLDPVSAVSGRLADPTIIPKGLPRIAPTIAGRSRPSFHPGVRRPSCRAILIPSPET